MSALDVTGAISSSLPVKGSAGGSAAGLIGVIEKFINQKPKKIYIGKESDTHYYGQCGFVVVSKTQETHLAKCSSNLVSDKHVEGFFGTPNDFKGTKCHQWKAPDGTTIYWSYYFFGSLADTVKVSVELSYFAPGVEVTMYGQRGNLNFDHKIWGSTPRSGQSMINEIQCSTVLFYWDDDEYFKDPAHRYTADQMDVTRRTPKPAPKPAPKPTSTSVQVSDDQEEEYQEDLENQDHYQDDEENNEPQRDEYDDQVDNGEPQGDDNQDDQVDNGEPQVDDYDDQQDNNELQGDEYDDQVDNGEPQGDDYDDQQDNNEPQVDDYQDDQVDNGEPQGDDYQDDQVDNGEPQVDYYQDDQVDNGEPQGDDYNREPQVDDYDDQQDNNEPQGDEYDDQVDYGEPQVDDYNGEPQVDDYQDNQVDNGEPQVDDYDDQQDNNEPQGDDYNGEPQVDDYQDDQVDNGEPQRDGDSYEDAERTRIETKLYNALISPPQSTQSIVPQETIPEETIQTQPGSVEEQRRSLQVQVRDDVTILEVKAMIARVYPIEALGQRLQFDGKDYEDSLTLAECNVTVETRVLLLVRLKGGGIPVYRMDKNLMDPQYDYDFTGVVDTCKFIRGVNQSLVHGLTQLRDPYLNKASRCHNQKDNCMVLESTQPQTSSVQYKDILLDSLMKAISIFLCSRTE
eukprot:gene7222-8389_t